MNPAEVIVDFGLSMDHGSSAPTQSVKIASRVVMSLYTAKRLIGHLSMAVQRHESTYGPIEIEVQRRALRRPEGGAQS